MTAPPHRPPGRRPKLDAERAMWRELIESLRRAPASEATKVVLEIRAELDATFPIRGRE